MKSASTPVAEIRFATGSSSLGTILVAASRQGLCAVLLGDIRASLRDLRQRFPGAGLIADDVGLATPLARIAALIEFPAQGLDLPLDLRGTPFQRRVWRALVRIPVGATVSYGDIARSIHAPKAVRAVAQACGANVLAVVIPCHRVIRSDGALSGYRWGVARKRELLEREARQ
jgi:AraC family transcriptional regulator, regulatory protein of adaptative response / methylated-DNA-[protein]-cysteine methyltransferase